MRLSRESTAFLLQLLLLLLLHLLPRRGWRVLVRREETSGRAKGEQDTRLLRGGWRPGMVASCSRRGGICSAGCS